MKALKSKRPWFLFTHRSTAFTASSKCPLYSLYCRMVVRGDCAGDRLDDRLGGCGDRLELGICVVFFFCFFFKKAPKKK